MTGSEKAEAMEDNVAQKNEPRPPGSREPRTRETSLMILFTRRQMVFL